MISSNARPHSAVIALQKKLDYLQQVVNGYCDKERTDVFQYFMPSLERDKYEHGFDYYDLKIDSPNQFIFNNKAVKKIRLMHSQAKYKASSGCIYFSFIDGSKETRSIHDDYLHIVEAAIAQCTSKNKTFNFRFTNPGQNCAPWKRTYMSSIYSDNEPTWEQKLFDPTITSPKENYRVLHARIINNITAILENNPTFNFNIIDGGCGEGDLLYSLENKLAEKKIQNNVNLFGFDYNADNIQKCQRRHKGKCQFSEGNLLNIDKIIADAKQKGILNPKYATLVILSGSLTNCVLHNAFEAALVLQKIKLSSVDVIIGGGHGTPFINHFMLKRIGYNLTTDYSSNDQSYFICWQFNKQEILQNKINKINKSIFLDLTLHPAPEQCINDLCEQKIILDGLTIDLSYCQPTESLLSCVTDINKKFPNIQWVFWHWDLQAINLVVKALGSSAKLDIKRTTEDSYLLSTRRFFNSVMSKAKKTDISEFKEAKLDYYDIQFMVNTENYAAMEAVVKDPKLKERTREMLIFAFNKKAFDIVLFILSVDMDATLPFLAEAVNRRTYLDYHSHGDTILHMAVRDFHKISRREGDLVKLLDYFSRNCGGHSNEFRNTNYLDESLVTLARKNLDAPTLLLLNDIGLHVYGPQVVSKEFIRSSPLSFQIQMFGRFRPKKLTVVDIFGDTILHKAAYEHDEKTRYLEKISQFKINYNVKNGKGETISHILAAKGEISGFLALAECKIDYSAKNKVGETPLHVAYQNQRLNIVDYLLKKSWKLYFTKDKAGKYPIEYVDEKNCGEVCKQTEKNLLDILPTLSKSDNTSFMKQVVEMKKNLNAKLSSNPKLFQPVALTVAHMVTVLDNLIKVNCQLIGENTRTRNFV